MFFASYIITGIVTCSSIVIPDMTEVSTTISVVADTVPQPIKVIQTNITNIIKYLFNFILIHSCNRFV